MLPLKHIAMKSCHYNKSNNKKKYNSNDNNSNISVRKILIL